MISKKDLQKLSELSRISVSDGELDTFPNEISAILDYVGQVNKVVSKEGKNASENVVNAMREDRNSHDSKLHTDVILDEAPDRQGNYLKVKKIL